MRKKLIFLSIFCIFFLGLSGAASAITMTANFTADNVIDNWWLVDNGTETLLDRTPLSSRGLWATADSVIFNLADGHSYSLIWKARNTGTSGSGDPTSNPAGFLADLNFGSYSILTAADWQVSQPGTDWFDAIEYGNNGSLIDPSQVWGEIANISTEAQWIWSSGNFCYHTHSDVYIKVSFETAPVPEPATILLLGSGLLGLGWYGRKRKK